MPDVPAFASIGALSQSGIAVDAVSLCTPPQVRLAIAHEAIDAGYDVMLEKPPAPSLSGAEALVAHAEAAKVVLFATWHSRAAPMVERARAFLVDHPPARVHICWRENVRQWHPGQEWLWQAGGLGVFDPGINALSILTQIMPGRIVLDGATLEVPANRQTPIAASLAMRSDDAPITAEFDFREEGRQRWTIAVETADGQRLELIDGGAGIAIGDAAPEYAEDAEYPALYARFAELVRARQSDVDLAPLRLVADAFLLGERRVVEPFTE